MYTVPSEGSLYKNGSFKKKVTTKVIISHTAEGTRSFCDFWIGFWGAAASPPRNKQKSDLDNSVSGRGSWLLSLRRPAESLPSDSDAYHSFSRDLVLLYEQFRQTRSRGNGTSEAPDGRMYRRNRRSFAFCEKSNDISSWKRSPSV